MQSVPDRFIGYAFCVGDVLLELNQELEICHIDGAVKQLFGDDRVGVPGQKFTDLLDRDDETIFVGAVNALGSTSRIGPIHITAHQTAETSVKLVAFIARLPTNEQSLYVALTRPYRLGLQQSVPADDGQDLSVEEQAGTFFKRAQQLILDDTDRIIGVTIVEAQQNKPLATDEQQRISQILRSFSVGGDSASPLANSKFALLHHGAVEDEFGFDLASEIQRLTGFGMTAATLDGDGAYLADEDAVRALLFCLRRYAEGEEGYALESLSKNCAVMVQNTSRRVTDFRQLLSSGAFNLVYQPIVDLQTGKTRHFEALSRFPDDFGDSDSRFEMITFAEEVGLIREFDLSVVSRAFEKLRSIVKAKAALPTLAVNVSGYSLQQPSFIEALIAKLRSEPQLVSNLVVEITESFQIKDPKQLSTVLQQIRACGVRVFLDDFGVGASGFQYLRDLEIDALKIDGSYIRGALTSEKDRAFLSAMVALCRGLGVVTVGEWVESRDQADLLRRLGVSLGQGYYFGKPSKSLRPVTINYTPSPTLREDEQQFSRRSG